VYLDRSAAGGYTNGSLLGGEVLLPPGGIPFVAGDAQNGEVAASVDLHVFVDHSVIEVGLNLELVASGGCTSCVILGTHVFAMRRVRHPYRVQFLLYIIGIP
jgi:hypothetical protein